MVVRRFVLPCAALVPGQVDGTRFSGTRFCGTRLLAQGLSDANARRLTLTLMKICIFIDFHNVFVLMKGEPRTKKNEQTLKKHVFSLLFEIMGSKNIKKENRK